MDINELQSLYKDWHFIEITSKERVAELIKDRLASPMPIFDTGWVQLGVIGETRGVYVCKSELFKPILRRWRMGTKLNKNEIPLAIH